MHQKFKLDFGAYPKTGIKIIIDTKDEKGHISKYFFKKGVFGKIKVNENNLVSFSKKVWVKVILSLDDNIRGCIMTAFRVNREVDSDIQLTFSVLFKGV